MSVIFQLPEDILHCVYSEWLGWKDLSQLDIACAGQSTRNEWLTSLGGVRMSRRLGNISDDIFYVWLGKHRVFCLEGFPMLLGRGLQYIVKELGLDFFETYCPAIHSIEILPGRRLANTRDHQYVYLGGETYVRDTSELDASELENYLTLFLIHCHGLRELTIVLHKAVRLVLRVLRGEQLTDNILTKIDMKDNRSDCKTTVMIANLLRKHALSLQELHLSIREGVDVIISTLIESEIHLKVLDISLGGEDVFQPLESWLIPYLSASSGGSSRGMVLLEVLEIKTWKDVRLHISNDCLVSIGRLCPKLTRLVVKYAYPYYNDVIFRLLCEQCPNLEYVYLGGETYVRDTRRYTVQYVVLLIRGPSSVYRKC
eukprot:scaffold6125_cov262-Ochromonas_danica.AAC.3